MAFYIPRSRSARFDQKPNFQVEIDQNHPIADNIVGLWLGNPYDLTNYNPGTRVGNLLEGNAGDNGSYFAVADDNTNSRIDLGSIVASNPLSCNATQEISIFTIFDFFDPAATSGNNFPRIIDKSTSGIGANGFAFYQSLQRMVFACDTQNANSSNLTYGKVAARIGVTYKPGSLHYYLDGTNDAEITTVTNPIPATTCNAALLNWNSGTDRQLMVPNYLILVCNKKLSADMMLSLYYDPYQYVKQRGYRLYIINPAGGPIVASFNLATNLTETISKSAILNSTMSLNTDYSDSPNNSLISNNQLNLSINPIDSYNSLLTTFGNLTLTKNLTDTVTGSLVADTQLSLTTTLTDLILNNANLGTNLSLTFDKSLITASNLVAAVQVSFTTDLGDVYSATVDTPGALEAFITLASNLSITSTAQVDYNPSLNLNINLNETQLANASFIEQLLYNIDASLQTTGVKELIENLTYQLSTGLSLNSNISLEGSISLNTSSGFSILNNSILSGETLFTTELLTQIASQAIQNAGITLTSSISLTTNGSNPALAFKVEGGAKVYITMKNNSLFITKK